MSMQTAVIVDLIFDWIVMIIMILLFMGGSDNG